MIVEEILNEIHKGGYELSVYEYLSKYLIKENTKLENQNSEYRATINLVKKLNQGKNKFIDNACEVAE